MARAPQDPKEIFQEIIQDYKGLYGDDLISIVLYGSATGEAYRPGESDINFMIVLSEEGIEHLDRAFDVVAKWRKRKVAVPLFLTRGYIDTSMDVFPVEYLNFQRNYVLLHGKDLLKDLSFDRGHVRLQCEREIKGKLLLLREAYLESFGKAKALKQLISNSLPAFVAIFEALLFIKETAASPDRRETIRAACEAYGLDGGLFEKLLDVKQGKRKVGDDEIRRLFPTYLKEVRKLYTVVDAMEG